jgi:SAM-dependent methyltransferase
MNASTQKLLKRYYSDPKYDGTGLFYEWVRSIAKPSDHVLNLGAGPATNSPQRCLKGEVAEVVGADIDPIVLKNPELDRALLVKDGHIAADEGAFNLIYCDYVLEHVEHPRQFLAEVYRLLTPGGTFLFRTPNKYHYVTLISSLTPHSFHERTANSVRDLPADDAHAPWPTFYRMNTRSGMRKLASKAGFAEIEMRTIECEPSYLQFHSIPFLVGMAYERLVNATSLLEGTRANILGRFVKPMIYAPR